MVSRGTLLLTLLLSGCATMPEAVQFHFSCNSEGKLYAGASFESLDGMWIAEVGRCLGDLKIIGLDKGSPL